MAERKSDEGHKVIEDVFLDWLVGKQEWKPLPIWDLNYAMELASEVGNLKIKKVKLNDGRWLPITPLEQAIAVDFYNACEKLYYEQLIP